MSFNQVIRDPADRIRGGRKLLRLAHDGAVFQHTPGKHCGSKGHGQAELDMVARIEQATGQVHAIVAAIAQTRVCSP